MQLVKGGVINYSHKSLQVRSGPISWSAAAMSHYFAILKLRMSVIITSQFQIDHYRTNNLSTATLHKSWTDGRRKSVLEVLKSCFYGSVSEVENSVWCGRTLAVDLYKTFNRHEVFWLYHSCTASQLPLGVTNFVTSQISMMLVEGWVKSTIISAAWGAVNTLCVPNSVSTVLL